MREATVAWILLVSAVVPAFAERPPDCAPTSTTNYKLGRYVEELVSEYEGEDGRWVFKLYDVQMMLLTDESRDRMRLIAPIRDASDLPPEELEGVPTVCGSLRQACEALDADRDFLKKGGVFTDDQIDGYLELKMEEVTRFRMTTHPIEFDMYYSL